MSAGRGYSILLVDDDELDVENVRRAFCGDPRPLWVASDGEHALRLLRTGQVPLRRLLVLLDLNMPRMTGIEFLREVRGDTTLRALPVVVLTTSDSERERIEAFHLNVAGYIVKPVTMSDFVEAVRALDRYWTLCALPASLGPRQPPPAPPEPEPEPEPAPTKRLDLLVVDDDEIDRERVRRALRVAGLDATVVERETVEGALEVLAARRFDAAILDYRLPGADGGQLLAEVQRFGVELPIIVLTGHGGEQVAVELMKAGAADYLSKDGLTPERLARTIHRALRLHAAQLEARQAQQQREAQRALLEEVLQQMPAGVVLAAAPTGELLMSNARLERLLGAPFDPACGDREPAPYVAYGSDGRRLGQDDWPLSRSLRGGEVVSVEPIACERADGHRVYLEASAGPVRDATGQIVAAVMTLHDVTSLQRAIRDRDDVLAVVSHDLRNPLNTISLAAQMMPDATIEDTAVQPAAIIRRAVQRANTLIEDLLDVSRIEAGQLNLERVDCDPAELVRQAVDDHQALALAGGIDLVAEPAADLPATLRIDRRRILQALGNLVSNAVRFTAAGGRITIAARQARAVEQQLLPPESFEAAAEALVLAVSDTGEGIAAEHLPHVFDRFWQARTHRRAGAGLGLAIVKGIVDAHGGRVWADSECGVGSDFCLLLRG